MKIASPSIQTIDFKSNPKRRKGAQGLFIWPLASKLREYVQDPNDREVKTNDGFGAQEKIMPTR